MSEDLKEVAARVPLEVFNQGLLDVVDEVAHPDFVDHGPPTVGISPDRDGIKTLATRMRQAFPDLRNSIKLVIAEGDVVAMHVTTTGTMKGEFAGMPATGKQATWDAIHIIRFRDGKAAEHWGVQDQLGLLVQLGYAQLPGAAQPAS